MATRTRSPNSQNSSSESFGGRAPGNTARKSRAKADSAWSKQEDTPNQVQYGSEEVDECRSRRRQSNSVGESNSVLQGEF